MAVCGELNMNYKSEVHNTFVGMNKSPSESQFDLKLKVKLCVGGTLFITTHDTLQTFPGTRLAKLTQSSTPYDQVIQEHFFDRDPIAFACILNYYRTTELHLPNNICANAIRRELEYWNINEESVSDCCSKLLYNSDQDKSIRDILIARVTYEYPLPRRTTTNAWEIWKYRLWLLLDKPNSSLAAKIWFVLFMMVVLASTIFLCLESFPGTRIKRMSNYREIVDKALLKEVLADLKNAKLKLLIETDAHPILYGFDLACLVIFSIELFLHFAVCPHKGSFFTTFLNLIDTISVCFGWIVLGFEYGFNEGLFVLNLQIYLAYLAITCLHSLRVFRFFRLIERFVELKVMMLAIKASIAELTIIILAIIFGSLAFYCEFSNNQFDSISISIWWAIITMTTVGYGDYYPNSHCGRIVGSLCAFCGILVLAMPIAILAINFKSYNFQLRCRERRIRLWGKDNKVGTVNQNETSS